MCLATIAIRGPTLDVVELLRRVPHIEPDVVWRVGDRQRFGYVSVDSGFSATIAEEDSWGGMLPNAVGAVIALRDVIDDARRLGATARVSFALFLGQNDRPYEAAAFTSSDLRVFVEAGVSLELCAYPVNDE